MIKDQMDKKFGSPWHVVVGKGFAYEITYEVGAWRRRRVFARGGAGAGRFSEPVLLPPALLMAAATPTSEIAQCSLLPNCSGASLRGAVLQQQADSVLWRNDAPPHQQHLPHAGQEHPVPLRGRNHRRAGVEDVTALDWGESGKLQQQSVCARSVIDEAQRRRGLAGNGWARAVPVGLTASAGTNPMTVPGTRAVTPVLV